MLPLTYVQRRRARGWHNPPGTVYCGRGSAFGNPFVTGVHGTAPCVVIDPFAGSGTVGAVASGCGRNAVLIELNPAYVEMEKRRCGEMLCDEVTG